MNCSLIIGGLAVGSLLFAGLASITIAFVMPRRLALVARVGLEWATALSGVGYLGVAFFIKRRLSLPLCSGTIILAHLPLGIVLALHALEPFWEELIVGRTLGLSIWRIAIATIRKARSHLLAAGGLYLSRLLADIAIVSAILLEKGWQLSTFALILISVLCFRRCLGLLIAYTGRPIYPPLFGPLPALSRKLRVTPRLNLSTSVLLYAALLSVTAAALLEFVGLTTLGQFSFLSFVEPVSLLIIITLLTWIWDKAQKKHWHTLSLAALSPIIWAYPAVMQHQMGKAAHFAITLTGLLIYATLQNGAARWAHSQTARHTLSPGNASPAAAVGALGLPLFEPLGRNLIFSQTLSATATWFAGAAFLIVFHNVERNIPRAAALAWAIMAAFSQGLALILRSTQPRPRLYENGSSNASEAL